MKYFFELGSNRDLSLAELISIFPKAKQVVAMDKVAIFEIEEIDTKDVIKKIGGTIKIGEVVLEVKELNEKDILNLVSRELDKISDEKKIKFGISLYGIKKFNTKKIAMTIKRGAESSHKARWVSGKEAILSSVIVKQNKLLDDGFELVLIKGDGKYLIGFTRVVQDFKDLSDRDYGRPGRDDLSGMIPPKLAQIMLNLSQAKLDETILDPFCGSGTILTEAMLMGYENILGTDVSKKAVEDSKLNIKWIKEKYSLNASPTVKHLDVRKLSKQIKLNSIQAIITEPYLGPQRGKREAEKIVKELNALYTQAIGEFAKILVKGGVVVMIWPSIGYGRGYLKVKPNFKGFQIEKLLINKDTITYGREGQKVWREVVKLKKI